MSDHLRYCNNPLEGINPMSVFLRYRSNSLQAKFPCWSTSGIVVLPYRPLSYVCLFTEDKYSCARIMPESLTVESVSAYLSQCQTDSSQVSWRQASSAFLKSALSKPKHRKAFRMPILHANQLVKARTAKERMPPTTLQELNIRDNFYMETMIKRTTILN